MSDSLDNSNGAGADPLQQDVDPFQAAMESKADQKPSARTEQTEPSDTAPDLADHREGAGPVGQGEYIVKCGDCISSIAKETGHLWEAIWNDPGNAELKSVRQDPNILLPGDRVVLPSKGGKQESGVTETRHRFKRKGEPGILRLVIREMGEPRANVPYILKVAGRELSGFTDFEGRLQNPIPTDAKTATLTVGEGEDQDEYTLNLGDLDPLESISGVQARLRNLGYNFGPADGIHGPRTTAAIETFCADHNLETPPAGQIGPEVRNRLREVHGF